ncbi:hypothetical protein D3C77_507680 [compost metagenome]
MQGDSGVVYQHADSLIATQALLHLCQVSGLAQIGRKHFHINPILCHQAGSQRFKPLTIAGDQ